MLPQVVMSLKEKDTQGNPKGRPPKNAASMRTAMQTGFEKSCVTNVAQSRQANLAEKDLLHTDTHN